MRTFPFTILKHFTPQSQSPGEIKRREVELDPKREIKRRKVELDPKRDQEEGGGAGPQERSRGGRWSWTPRERSRGGRWSWTPREIKRREVELGSESWTTTIVFVTLFCKAVETAISGVHYSLVASHWRGPYCL